MKRYSTGGSVIEPLNPHKLKQRRKLCELLKSKGTILELFSGRGNLTEQLYSKFSKKNIMVEKEHYPELERFDSKRYEIHYTDNLKFLKNELTQIPDLTLVDFDAFGMPIPQVKLFFENYKVTQPLLIGLTDGSARWIQMNYHKPKLINETYRKNGYWCKFKKMNVLLFLKMITKKTMAEIGEKYGLQINYVNSADSRIGGGGKKTVYMGFEVKP